MRVQNTTPRNNATASAALAVAPGIPNYTGPKETASEYDAGAARWLKPANKALVGAWMHTDIQGTENIPEDGAHLLCFNHESMSDASLVQSLTDGDYRFVAAKEQFVGKIGQAMKALGAIPVDRDRPSAEVLQVTTDLLNAGTGVAIAPEGGIKADGRINRFKEGPAKMALESQCESLVPVVLDYQPHQVGTLNRLGTYLAAGAVAVGGLAAAFAGGPTAKVVAGAVTGLLTGAALGGAAGFAVSNKEGFDRMIDAAKGAGIGAVAGGVGGGFAPGLLGESAHWLMAPTSVVGGAVALAGAKFFNERKDAKVIVGEGIPVAPYRQMEDQLAARKQLTRDLRVKMLELHQEIRPDIQYDFDEASHVEDPNQIGGDNANWDEMDNTQRVTHLVSRQLRIEAGKVAPDATFQELGADSLDTVEMFVSLEKAFEIEIPDDAAAQLQSVNDVVAYLEEKLPQQPPTS